MYYSVIGLLAVLTLLIVNQDILFYPEASYNKPAWKVYRRFLFAVLIYYITDIMWGIIESKKPGVIGLYNSSGSPIEFSYQGRTGVCPDKNPMPLLPGMILHAGNTSIEIL